MTDAPTTTSLADRWFCDSDRLRDRFRTRTLIEATLTFVVIVVVFSGVVVALEVWWGAPLRAAHLPSGHSGWEDALWHLATAFLLALPVRHKRVAVLAPVFALAIDVDHLFGAVLPTVTLRTAHNVFLVAILCVALALRFGRPFAMIAVGAVGAHLAVDGGSFPLFGPVSTGTWELDLPLQAVLLIGGGLLFFLSVHTPGNLVQGQRWVYVLGAIVLLIAMVALLWPALNVFNQT